MATLAQIFDRFRLPEEMPQPATPERTEPFRLRSFPNEELHFFVKAIDNSRVVRESDPGTRRTCWRMIGTSCAVAVFVTGMFLPTVNNLLAGYKIEHLRAERQQLEADRAELQYQETKLLTTEHLQELAEKQKFLDPSQPQRTLYLDGRPEGSMARVTGAKTEEVKP